MNEAAYRALPGCCRDTLDSFRQSPFLEYRRTFPHHEPDHRGRSMQACEAPETPAPCRPAPSERGLRRRAR